MNKFVVNKNDENQSLFKFLKKTFKTTPISVIYKWIRNKSIKINSKRVNDKNYLLKLNDIIEVYDSNKPIIRDQFKYISNTNLDIVYEDKNILIVNKPNNLEIHSLYNDCLDNMVKSYLVDKKEYDIYQENSFVVSHVHRLDKLTSGLVIYAKNKISSTILTNAFKNKDQIEKYYYALTSNDWILDNYLIVNGYINYNSDIKKADFSLSEKNNYKYCQTEFKLINKNLILVKLITGKKHQIRSILSFYNNPVLNDFRYNGKKINDLKMIYLAAFKIKFKNLEKPLDYLNNKEFIKNPKWISER
ncbi:RluA family pseudouridine synthase [Mycoplasma feriruminatoris]|uniref:RNA pseudouridylate synthase n=1 Tax=Mycoplasma feriruminatoris TaxID=1179777 RepID=A0AAQ3HWP6_9MOLU|nr:RluA family pseudouridine synthase [Mycoplasma feriruminatoris]WFQ92421.1 Ribosomal large subunit pseudouridine synthase C [Mycoplasma feriruminatoris]WFQ94949.1 RNA pseudouridylate synthase [Mycoplasma feriruminatoris]WFQ95775.1 RNA pseudouridylate synthase [Mycoplasma feriruminatoris]